MLGDVAGMMMYLALPLSLPAYCPPIPMSTCCPPARKRHPPRTAEYKRLGFRVQGGIAYDVRA